MTPALILTLLTAAAVPATPTERLVHLAELWGTVKFLHPYLAYRRIDWDAALVTAAARVRAAGSTDAYRAAVSSMLDVLHDPATHVLRSAELAPPQRPPPAGKVLRPLRNGKLLLDLTVLHGEQPTAEEAAAINSSLAAARGVVVDLRVAEDSWLSSLPFYPALVSDQVDAPARRALLHAGYRPQGGVSSGGYESMVTVRAGERFQPPPGAVAKRVAFLVHRDGPVLPVALALWARGEGALVAEGPLDDEAAVRQVPVDLGEGLIAAVRVEELESRRLRADVTVPAGGDPVAAALAWIEHGKAGRRRPATPLPPPVWAPDATYERPEYPDAGHRLLAVARLWSVIHFFYPYLPLIGEDWNRTVLPRFIPRVEAAGDAQQYGLAIAEMATFVADGHTSVGGGRLDRFFGAAQPPITVRVIEGVLVVEEIHDSAARTAGVAVGDVVVAVDGEPALARLQRLGKYVAASHEVAHRLYVAGQMLGGAEGSMAALTLRGADGRDRSVRLARTMTGAPSPHRGGEVVKVLPRNVGYIDLERLEPGGVSAALERIKATRGLVLDLRGYPKITTWELAARLNITRAPWAAAFQRPLVGGEAALEGDGGARLSFMQPLPPPRGWVYDKPVVTLIDERAISRAEHTALFLETACHPRFVGSPTAGANGDVTTFTLPGGLRVWFTGHDVRHADGRQLQRVGIQPHVAVTPTIAGLRAGRDEVLERAVREIP